MDEEIRQRWYNERRTKKQRKIGHRRHKNRTESEMESERIGKQNRNQIRNE